ncbi:mitochondrial carrier domain-containing protein [Chytriomyces sp. MP71]|nr:mitochondrial carrier domain-containing protein [Chytriomyces sp. MP71]
MQSKGKYNYNNAIDGLIRIGREEGVQAYFTGVEITVIRAILMTAGQLVTYDLAKEAILASGILGDGLPTHFLSSLLGGLVATTICAPADVVKSRIMAQRKEKPVYTGTLDAFAKIYHDEGPLAFFNGWLLAFARLAPQTILTFVILEKLKYYYAHLILVLSGGILLKYLHNVELLVTLGVTLVFLMGKGHVTF